MHDEIRRLSDELARDPGSRAFARLAELLRAEGQHTVARQIVERGLRRHPYDTAAHRAFARIALDVGDVERAHDEWDMARQLDPGDAEALKGLAFIAHQRGDLAGAARLLREARALTPGDDEIAAALQRLVPASAPSPAPPPSPAPVAPRDAEALRVDSSGFVVDGVHRDAEGRDVSAEIGAHLAGVRSEAERLLEHLALGSWESLRVEGAEGTLALAPAPGDTIVFIAAPGALPLGQVRHQLQRALARVGGGGDA